MTDSASILWAMSLYIEKWFHVTYRKIVAFGASRPPCHRVHQSIIKGNIQGSQWLIPVVSNTPIVPLTYCDWTIICLWSLMGVVPLVHWSTG